ncbi:MAG: type II toxin-antitoxin system HicB family antitoxin [Rikenellaceae bacterium]
MKREIEVIVTYLDNYGAYCDLLPGCVATHSTLSGVKELFNDAVALHLKGIADDNEQIPEEFSSEYILTFKLNTQALLKHYKGIVSLSSLSKVAGINMKQLSHYASGIKTPRPQQREKIIHALHQIGQDFVSVH